MDSPMNYSRLSKPDSEIFKSTGTSLVFKTVGRNTKPTWSNRIIKDVNDLQYNLDIDLLGKHRFQSVTLQKRRLRNLSAEKKAKVSVREKRKSFFSQQLEKVIKSGKEFADRQLRANQQSKVDIPRRRNHSTIESYGLSSFEYKNTISGKLHTRPNLHLIFDKKAERRMGQKITWYNPELQINMEKMDQKKQIFYKQRYRRVLGKYHAFQSYTDRKVFDTKDKLDKVYETDQGKRVTSPNRIKRTVPLETVPGRKQETIKESSYLSYEISRGEEATRDSPPKYSIMNTPKQFSFSKQVISSKRGCYR